MLKYRELMLLVKRTSTSWPLQTWSSSDFGLLVYLQHVLVPQWCCKPLLLLISKALLLPIYRSIQASVAPNTPNLHKSPSKDHALHFSSTLIEHAVVADKKQVCHAARTLP